MIEEEKYKSAVKQATLEAADLAYDELLKGSTKKNVPTRRQFKRHIAKGLDEDLKNLDKDVTPEEAKQHDPNHRPFDNLFLKNFIQTHNQVEANNIQIFRDSLGWIKTIMGVANTAPYIYMGDMLDKLKQTPFFKGNNKRLLKKPLEEYRNYESNLRFGTYSTKTGNIHEFFTDIVPTPEQFDQGYKVITKKQAFEWWLDIGAMSYKRIYPTIEKLRLAVQNLYEEKGMHYAEEVSYFAVVDALTQYAVNTYDAITTKLFQTYGAKVEIAFKEFRLTRVMDAINACYSIMYAEARRLKVKPFKDLTVKAKTDKFEDCMINEYNTAQSAHEAILENKDLFCDAYINRYMEAYENDMKNYKERKKK